MLATVKHEGAILKSILLSIVSIILGLAQASALEQRAAGGAKQYLVLTQGSLYESKGNRGGNTVGLEITPALLAELKKPSFQLSCVFETQSEQQGRIVVDFTLQSQLGTGGIRGYDGTVTFSHHFFESRLYNAKHYNSAAKARATRLEDLIVEQFGEASISVGRGGNPPVIENFLTLQVSNSMTVSSVYPQASFLPMPGVKAHKEVTPRYFPSIQDYRRFLAAAVPPVKEQFSCAVFPRF